MSTPPMLRVEDDPFNFTKYADPYPNYRRVRETTPVYWSQLLGGWVLTRHADVKAALVDPRISAARTRDAQAAQLSEDLRRQLAPVDELLGRWALFQDNPAHGRIRQALSGAFTPSLMAQLRQRVQVLADGLIDAARGRGEMDLVADFALRLPAMVIAELLGVSSSDSERFQRWVHTIALYFAIGSLGNVETIAALRETVEQMAGYMRAIVDDHRRAPRGDLIGNLIGSGRQDEQLSEVEILSQCMLLLHGGYESTMNTISSGMLHILRDRPAAPVRRGPRPGRLGRRGGAALRTGLPVRGAGRDSRSRHRWPGDPGEPASRVRARRGQSRPGAVCRSGAV
jgi:cytochrome P450